MKTNNEEQSVTERILSRTETAEMLGLSLSSLMALEAQDSHFPTRRQVTPKRGGFLLSEIVAWMRQRPEWNAEK